MSLRTVIEALKGGQGSGNFDHKGIPGKVGGSAPSSFSPQAITNALDVVGRLVRSGGKMDVQLSDEAQAFLRQTVEDKDYKLQRGMHLMRFRVDRNNFDELNALHIGDKAPDYLTKSGTNYTSFTSKPSVANYYAKEGHMGLVIETSVPRERVLADLKNLQNVLKKHNVTQSEFNEEDFKYFKRDAEVIIDGLPESYVISKYGKL